MSHPPVNLVVASGAWGDLATEGVETKDQTANSLCMLHCTCTEQSEACHWRFVALDQDRDNIGKLYGPISSLKPDTLAYRVARISRSATCLALAACCDDPDSPLSETFRTASAADAAGLRLHQSMSAATYVQHCTVAASRLKLSHSPGHLMAVTSCTTPQTVGLECAKPACCKAKRRVNAGLATSEGLL
jgi:hypothetical protein